MPFLKSPCLSYIMKLLVTTFCKSFQIFCILLIDVVRVMVFWNYDTLIEIKITLVENIRNNIIS